MKMDKVMQINPNLHSWMTKPETKTVMSALGDARFVGGCVRNTLLHKPIKDIDIATPLLPEEVIRRLEAAGLKHIPTGIAHGTVTALAFSKEGFETFEITTLRKDVTTDGRRATVAFTDSWKEDSFRRDFTMNALYCDLDGRIYDYNYGIVDLEEGRVRFVGDAVTRIREDALRILRLFRFHAYYGKGQLDMQAVLAASSERELLKGLSGERIQSEMMQLMSAPHPGNVLDSMQMTDILTQIIPIRVYVGRLTNLLQIERDNHFHPDPLLRLTALAHPDPAMMNRWRFSNDMKARVRDAQHHVPFSVADAKKLLYKIGQRAFRDSVLVRWADDSNETNALRWRGLLHLADRWATPVFPITGRHIMARGIPQGPKVGAALDALERMWIDMNFPDDPEEVFAAVSLDDSPERRKNVTTSWEDHVS